MRAKLIALGAVVAALCVGPIGPAFAAGPPSEADQSASNSATADSTNTSITAQEGDQSQASDSSCKFGCGGSGQAQSLEQDASTQQLAGSQATADQTAVNANVPVSVSAGDVSGGSNSASQEADNSADATSSNRAITEQDASQSQEAGSQCFAGCGGSGQAQSLEQDASTRQLASSKANADQTAVNANVPVVISAGEVRAGDNSADQRVSNEASADSSNKSATLQGAAQEQSTSSSCKLGCGGSGQAQELTQSSATWQAAFSAAAADQTAVNANVPVVISAGDFWGGDNSASQSAENDADASSRNLAVTEQQATQSQDASSHCFAGCGGSGQAQSLEQTSETGQKAFSWADADQTLENANTPVTVSKGKKDKKAKKARKKRKKGGHTQKR